MLPSARAIIIALVVQLALASIVADPAFSPRSWSNGETRASINSRGTIQPNGQLQEAGGAVSQP